MNIFLCVREISAEHLKFEFVCKRSRVPVFLCPCVSGPSLLLLLLTSVRFQARPMSVCRWHSVPCCPSSGLLMSPGTSGETGPSGGQSLSCPNTRHSGPLRGLPTAATSTQKCFQYLRSTSLNPCRVSMIFITSCVQACV